MDQDDEEDEEETEEQLKEALMSTQHTLEEKLTHSELSIFSDGKAIRSDQFKKPKLVTHPTAPNPSLLTF